ncbi:heparan-sulfate 6-O-sulfotransferase 1-B [Nematostella vectensis]|uniref:heparan-sulfate 6-O-sulfotransferase 1-B n=1 Tax=Nematostella vectensis TaxID=45351 RepID=UPI0020771B72|nr:heparan-sulfate 6-O-sulfotransferase 1-B [Nematostella vectensis]
MTLQGNWKKFCLLLTFCALTFLISVLYLCSNSSCDIATLAPNKLRYLSEGNPQKMHRIRFGFTIKESIKKYQFDFAGTDVMVFLHIQKTGGTTFGKHLVTNLQIRKPCDCSKKKGKKFRCTCNRPNSKKIWLFARYALGWPCGLHADYTELTECVPKFMNKRDGREKRRFLYVTMLREPMARVISEFLCYTRGTTWAESKHKCKGKVPTKEELPPCYTGDNWMDVTLEGFNKCSSNLAFNRQARMLADLKLVNCYNRTNGPSPRKRGKIILKSAMKNLRNMAYFGLAEYQKESQYLFEKTFGIKFMKPFQQKAEEETRSADAMKSMTQIEKRRTKSLNSLDIRLYDYAKALFFYRVRYFQKEEKRGEKQIFNSS